MKGSALIALFIDIVPLLRRKRTEHRSHVDEVEWLLPCPLLQDIVYFQDAVGRYPRDGRWEQIDSSDEGFKGQPALVSGGSLLSFTDRPDRCQPCHCSLSATTSCHQCSSSTYTAQVALPVPMSRMCYWCLAIVEPQQMFTYLWRVADRSLEHSIGLSGVQYHANEVALRWC